ncbi:hypothetical protein [Clostridium disporicum]|uniref:hypothetical protein n=1 Tax=Clostridium disporicum TaxID=84024 RepID=UPI0034A0E159
MTKKFRGSMFTGGGGGTHSRQVDDFYATPYETTRKILDEIKLEGSILESACGQGHISEVLKEYYPDQKIVSTDIVDRGYADELKDFLKDDFEKFDNVITNPPFKYAKEFVEKSLEISNDKVIMLLKIQFLESKSRKEFLQNSPLKYIYVFSERQNTMKDGSPINPLTGKPWSSTMLLAWFVWEKGYEGEPIVRWL